MNNFIDTDQTAKQKAAKHLLTIGDNYHAKNFPSEI